MSRLARGPVGTTAIGSKSIPGGRRQCGDRFRHECMEAAA